VANIVRLGQMFSDLDGNKQFYPAKPIDEVIKKLNEKLN